MDDVFLIHHPSGSFSCVVAYRVTTLPLQPQLSLTLSVMGANSKTQTTKCHVHYVLYTLKGIGVQSTVTEQWSVLTFKLTLFFFFSSVQREEDLKKKKELSLELANVREELGKRRFYTSSPSLHLHVTHAHIYKRSLSRTGQLPFKTWCSPHWSHLTSVICTVCVVAVGVWSARIWLSALQNHLKSQKMS